MDLKIIGTGRSMPVRAVANEELTRFLETDDAWIASRTGIRERRILTEESLTDLAAQAAMKALEDAQIDAGTLDLIICPTMQGDLITPSQACMVQSRIGAGCPAFDINCACTGFIYGLDIAAAYLETGRAETILIVCAEAMSRIVDWTDRGSCIVFADGAGAVVVTKGQGLKTTHLTACGDDALLRARPDGGNCPLTPEIKPIERLVMNGPEVYKFAVSAAVRDLQTVIEKDGASLDDVDWFLLHQANRRILEAVRNRLNQPEAKFPSNIARYGNTSAASLPILLDELNKADQIKEGQLLALSAFGAGLTTGACLIRWHETKGVIKSRTEGNSSDVLIS
ncbi:MAG TPA: 3-oxoacyl-ACP synthase [Peptococcaceae bacterium]|nr:3-oxoacyl-ACP synthase [Peptococcaceae bacterium]